MGIEHIPVVTIRCGAFSCMYNSLGYCISDDPPKLDPDDSVLYYACGSYNVDMGGDGDDR